MKQYLLIFFLLISILFVAGCSPTKGLVKDSNKIYWAHCPILKIKSEAILYQSHMAFGNKQFSGLFIFKLFPDSTYRIALLSEFGLNLLELKYKNHNFTVVSCKEFLDRKIILNTIKRSLKLIIDIPQGFRQTDYLNGDGNITLVKYKKPLVKFYYFYKAGKPVRIIESGFMKKVEVNAANFKGQLPQDITISNKIINLNIRFKLLNNK